MVSGVLEYRKQIDDIYGPSTEEAEDPKLVDPSAVVDAISDLLKVGEEYIKSSQEQQQQDGDGVRGEVIGEEGWGRAGVVYSKPRGS